MGTAVEDAELLVTCVPVRAGAVVRVPSSGVAPGTTESVPVSATGTGTGPSSATDVTLVIVSTLPRCFVHDDEDDDPPAMPPASAVLSVPIVSVSLKITA